MGLGDTMMAIGDARKLHAKNPGKKVAIGNGQRMHPSDLFHGLDYLADPSKLENVQWVISDFSMRPYIDYEEMRRRAEALIGRSVKRHHYVGVTGQYVFNKAYKASPGDIRFKPDEQRIVDEWSGRRFAVIEPNIKRGAPINKDWGFERFQATAKALAKHVTVYQLSEPGSRELQGVEQIRPKSYREAIAYLKASALYIGPEGGLHHGAAAVGTKAVVIFGGFASPGQTGYDMHVNLTGNSKEPCGRKLGRCPHCTAAMAAITPEEVLTNARKLLDAGGGRG